MKMEQAHAALDVVPPDVHVAAAVVAAGVVALQTFDAQRSLGPIRRQRS